MKKIAVLGPEGTYSDIACKKYISDNNLNYEIIYFPNILKTANAINEATLAILPFENTLDGFVVESMDYMIHNKYQIVSQLKLGIDFAFVTNAKSIEDVKYCYVQFKAYGQCLDFITKYGFNIIRTQSNMESLEFINNASDIYGAIIPMHVLNDVNFNLTFENIADSRNNETRFFIVQTNESEIPNYDELESSIVITALEDRPGILFDILKEFHELDINLKSIMSRPMKTSMGQYRFYIECSLNKNNLSKLNKLTEKMSNQKSFLIDVLGIYNKL